MKHENYLSELTNANMGRLFFAVILSVSVLSNLLLSVSVMNSDPSEKTIITPIGSSKEFWVHGDKVDSAYLEEMGIFFIELYTNYHPDNVDGRFDLILKHIDPRSHGVMKAVFTKDIIRIKKSKLASVFFPTEIHVKKNQIVFSGILQNIIAGKSLEPDNATYIIDFEYSKSRFFVDGIRRVRKEKSGEYIDYE